MRDLGALIAKLEADVVGESQEKAFQTVLGDIAAFYYQNLKLDENEVAILLANDDRTILSFAYPDYLVNAGMIPTNSTEAIAANVFRTGRAFIENNLQQQKHLSIFQIIKTPDHKIKLIWKMAGCLIAVGDEKLGVLEVSRRAVNFSEAGPDFGFNDLEFMEKSIAKLAPLLSKVLPGNFRGKLT
jgi:hypothetical protein